MCPQLTAWVKEYTKIKGVPTTTRASPSSAVINFLNFCKINKIPLGKNCLDIGCGNGRNSLYLAQKGFKITAIDFVPKALELLKQKAKEQNVLSKINILKIDFSKNLPFKSNSFDWAIDIVSTTSLDKDELQVFEKELRRVLKPGGLFLTYVHSKEDEYLKNKINKEGFYKIPESGLIEHAWSREELLELYKNWELICLKKREKKDLFYGKPYTRILWWAVFRKI